MAAGSEEFLRSELQALQLRIARRADELARDQPQQGAFLLHCGLLAEREVFREVGIVIQTSDTSVDAED